MRKTIMVFLIIFLLIPFTQVKATNTNNTLTNNKYSIIIEDDADLLTTAEEQQLRNQMTPLTEFGYVMFKTTNTVNGTGTSLRYIQNYYYLRLGNKSGVAFYIDMNKRQVCACATGGLDKTITSSKCDTIMDNIYRYATRGEYYECAKQAFIQMNQLLNGEKIAESMKYICNGIVALMLSLFVSCILYIIISNSKKATNNELINECKIFLDHSEIDVEKTGSHSVYSPVSDSSSGGSSGGSFSGGGGRRRWLFWKRRKPWILENKY